MTVLYYAGIVGALAVGLCGLGVAVFCLLGVIEDWRTKRAERRAAESALREGRITGGDMGGEKLIGMPLPLRRTGPIS